MPKLCKRIIALLLAFCLVFSLCLTSFAVSSENQASFWESWLAYLAGQNDHWSFLDGTGTFDMLGSLLSRDTVCGQSSDGYHHGTQIDSLVDGRAKVKCSECGEWFYYSASDLEDQYNSTLHDNGLGTGLSVSPDGGLFWYPTPDDISNFKLLCDSSTPSKPYFPCSSDYSGWTRDYSYNSSLRNIDIHCVNNNNVDLLEYGFSFDYNVPFPGYYTSDRLNIPYHRVSSSGDVYYGNLEKRPSISGRYSSTISVSFSDSFTHYCVEVVAAYPLHIFSVVPSSSVPVNVPSVPQSITINNNTYQVTDIDFNTRTVRVDDRTIIYDDDKIIIKQGDTVTEEYNYYIGDGEQDPGEDPGEDPADSSGSGSGSAAGGSGCCEQCALLLRQANQYLLQIQTLVDQINDKLGPDSDNYMQGIYNLLVEINNALDNLPTSPHTDYESKLTTICNQLANIWGDLENIKDSLGVIATNTNLTNNKLDTVHSDLEAVLAELQTQRGILQQILDTLKKILGHVATIDENVEELDTEEKKENFVTSFIGKFGFINDIYRITVQMMRDVTNDAISAQAVSDGIIPASVLSVGHAPEDDSTGDSSQSKNDSDFTPRYAALRSGSGATAPELVTRFPDVEFLGVNLSSYSAINLSWYAPYKSEVDQILSGFMYLGYLWLLFKRLPSIIRGGAMASSDYDQVQHDYYGKKGD